mgnify:CR=1 FL=1
MWNTYEYEFITTYEDVNRIILNFGEVGGTYYIDDIEFGLKIDDTMTNILAGDNSDFEGGTKGSWGSWVIVQAQMYQQRKKDIKVITA